MISSFSEFYNSLSSNGVFFFWIVVFLVVVLVILAIFLIVKNNKLSKLIKDNEFYNDASKIEAVKEEKIIELKDNDINDEIKIDKKENEKIVQDNKNDIISQGNIVKTDKVGIDSNLYQKNILREVNPRMQTSPINIEKQDSVYESKIDDETLLKEDTFGIDLGHDLVSPLEEMEDSFEVNDNMKFASEIVKQMEEEIKPSNIELTDYEKKQEEEAIISYDELLKVKDKIYNLTEDEETDNFIDELKSFRIDLQ